MTRIQPTDALASFADQLRQLRIQAGKPAYAELQRRTGYGRTALSEALNGKRLPSWEITQALVRVLGGDEQQWQARWAATAHALDGAGTDRPRDPAAIGAPRPDTADNAPTTDSPPSQPRWPTPHPAPRRRILIAGVGLVAAALLVAAVLVAILGPPGMLSGDEADSNAAAAAGLAPGSGTGQCMEVIARDVRVFTSSDTEDTLTTWQMGTKLWVQDRVGNPGRYRTPLRNGRHGWVTAQTRYLAPAQGCP